MTLLCVCTYTYYGLAGLQTIACDGEDLSLLLGTKWLFMASIVLMWVATVHGVLSMVVQTSPFSRIEAGRAALWSAMLASLDLTTLYCVRRAACPLGIKIWRCSWSTCLADKELLSCCARRFVAIRFYQTSAHSMCSQACLQAQTHHPWYLLSG